MKLTKENVYVSITDATLKEKLFSRPLEYNLELALFCLPEILNGPWRQALSDVRKVFKKYPVKKHLHGPFHGLQYDCKDPEVRQLAFKKYERVINIGGELQAEHIVVHSTFNPLNPDARYRKVWLQRSCEFWNSLIPIAQKNGCMLVLENIYDEDPSMIIKLIQKINSPYFKGCLDVGHANLFGSLSLAEWVEAYKAHLYHLHVHDNFGKTDDHMAIGSGNADFGSFFKALKNVRNIPAFVIEVTSETEFRKSMRYLAQHGYIAATE